MRKTISRTRVKGRAAPLRRATMQRTSSRTKKKMKAPVQRSTNHRAENEQSYKATGDSPDAEKHHHAEDEQSCKGVNDISFAEKLATGDPAASQQDKGRGIRDFLFPDECQNEAPTKRVKKVRFNDADPSRTWISEVGDSNSVHVESRALKLIALIPKSSLLIA